MDIEQFWNEFTSHREDFSKEERLLANSIMSREGCMVLGDASKYIKFLSALGGYEVVEVTITTREDVMGYRVVGEDSSGNQFFYRHCDWADRILQNPEKQFLLMFYVENADDKTINCLKSIVEHHDLEGHRMDNFFAAVVCRNEDREIKSTLNALLHPRKWVGKWSVSHDAILN